MRATRGMRVTEVNPLTVHEHLQPSVVMFHQFRVFLIVPLVCLLQILKWVITRKRLNVQWRVVTETQVSDLLLFLLFSTLRGQIGREKVTGPYSTGFKLETEIGIFFVSGPETICLVLCTWTIALTHYGNERDGSSPTFLLHNPFWAIEMFSPQSRFGHCVILFKFTLWCWLTKSVMPINEPRLDYLMQFHIPHYSVMI